MMAGRGNFGCNCYASGEDMYSESIMATAWKNILDWFQKIHSNPGFAEVEVVFGDDLSDSDDLKD